MDTIVSAQLPDKEKNPELYKTIVDHHLHNPCGSLNPHASCMVNGVCKFGFPFDYQDHTIDTEDGYHLYQRIKPEGDKFIERDKSVSFKNQTKLRFYGMIGSYISEEIDKNRNRIH